jgi:transcription elongation factor GreB
MGRYRSPSPPSAPYVTAEGAAALRAELEHLWRVRRPEVTRAVQEAAAQGDRSENAEYIYGKKQLREIDRRVRYLRRRLATVKVVSEPPADTTRIFFGAWFELESTNGEREMFRLVGADECDAGSNHVSVDSPLGRAVLGKPVAAELSVQVPAGESNYRVIRIAYDKKKPG